MSGGIPVYEKVHRPGKFMEESTTQLLLNYCQGKLVVKNC
jgi:hypothetical protein